MFKNILIFLLLLANAPIFSSRKMLASFPKNKKRQLNRASKRASTDQSDFRTIYETADQCAFALQKINSENECQLKNFIRKKWTTNYINNNIEQLEKYVAYQNIIPKLRYKACATIAEYYQDKNTKKAKKFIWVILKLANNKDLCNMALAKAHLTLARIYHTEREKKEEPNRSSFIHRKKARKFLKKILKKNNISKIKRSRCQENIFDCSLYIAAYHLCKILKNQHDEKKDAREKLIKRYLTEIIDYENKEFEHLKRYASYLLEDLAEYQKNHQT